MAMGVDANLWLGTHLSFEHITDAVARAQGKDYGNGHKAARETLETTSAVGMMLIRLQTRGHLYLHVCYAGPTGPAHLLSGRSTGEVIAIFHAVGSALGGFVVESDTDDRGVAYRDPEAENKRWLLLNEQVARVGRASHSTWEHAAAYKVGQ